MKYRILLPLLFLASCTNPRSSDAIHALYSSKDPSQHHVDQAAFTKAMEAERKRTDYAGLDFEHLVAKAMQLKNPQERSELAYRWFLQTRPALKGNQHQIWGSLMATGELPDDPNVKLYPEFSNE